MTKLAFACAAATALVSLHACTSKGKQTGAPEAVAKMTALVDRICACTDAACATKVNDEVVALTKAQSPHFTQAEVTSMAALGKKANDCFARVTVLKADAGSGSASGSGSGSAATPAGSGSDAPTTTGLPKECDDYKAVIDRLQTCDKLSKQARETLVKAYADTSEGWKKATGDEKTRIGVSCKAATDSISAMAKERCGW